MPTMWFAKDGPRPNSQRGPGTSITAEKAAAVVGLRELKYVGSEAPSINAETPSRYERNVILEVTSPQDTTSLMPKVGFYYVLGLQPEEASAALEAKRGAV